MYLSRNTELFRKKHTVTLSRLDRALEYFLLRNEIIIISERFLHTGTLFLFPEANLNSANRSAEAVFKFYWDSSVLNPVQTLTFSCSYRRRAGKSRTCTKRDQTPTWQRLFLSCIPLSTTNSVKKIMKKIVLSEQTFCYLRHRYLQLNSPNGK